MHIKIDTDKTHVYDSNSVFIVEPFTKEIEISIGVFDFMEMTEKIILQNLTNN